MLKQMEDEKIVNDEDEVDVSKMKKANYTIDDITDGLTK